MRNRDAATGRLAGEHDVQHRFLQNLGAGRLQKRRAKLLLFRIPYRDAMRFRT